MGKKLIRESIAIKVNWTENEKMQLVLQGSITVIAKVYQRFNEAIQLYERSGYEISSKDPDNLSFVAEKEYEVEEEEE